MYSNKVRYLFLGIVALATLAAMGWYVNKYIYNFFAATPTVKISITSSKNTVTVGEEFSVSAIVTGQNIDALDLYIPFHAGLVEYYKDYTTGIAPVTGITQLPVGYFSEPAVIEQVIPANGGNGKQLHVVLVALGQQRQKSVQINFKFRAKAKGDAQFFFHKNSLVAGVNESNQATYFTKDPEGANTTVKVVEPTTITITPTITNTPTPTPTVDPGITITITPSVTPPWVNTNYSTTTVWGIVRTESPNDPDQGRLIWRKDKTICPTKTYENSSTLKVVQNTNGTIQGGWFMDKCDGFDNAPYFLTVATAPGNSKSYALQGLPAGYECTTWEHRLRTLDDKSKTLATGTGCSTGPTLIDVKNVQSSYHNSHFFIFKIQKIATISQVITPTGPINISPSGPLVSQVASSSATLNMKIRFQGVNPATRKAEYNSVLVDVGVGSPGNSQKVSFTAEADGTYTGKVDLKNISLSRKYAIYIKGPKHLRKKICAANPTESLPGTYNCKGGAIQLNTGENTLDFSNLILLAGDLPNQDGVINSLDFAFLRQNFGSTDPEVLKRGDLNFDGIIHTDDHTIIKTALEFKYDEE